MKRKICKFKNQLISSSPNQLITKSAHLLILLLIVTSANLLINSSALAQSPQKMSYQCVVRNISGALVTNQVVGIKISILQGSASGTAVYTETLAPTTNANGLVSIEIGGGNGFELINWSAGPYFLKTETDPAGGTNYTITGTSQLLSVPYALYAKSAANGFSGNYNDLTDKPTLFSGSYNDLTNKPVLFSGNYNDLTNKPVLFDGTWTSLTGKPSTLAGYGITDAVTTSGDQTIAGNKTFTGTINASNKTITGVGNPINNQDAVTKAYANALAIAVDDKFDQLKAHIKILEDNLIDAGIYKLVDIDGNQYNYIKIGTQVWMAENLRTTKFNDGTAIPLGTANWPEGSPAYCWYNNDEATYKATYGALYNWSAVFMNGGKLCPTNWHVSTDDEWTTMENYLIANGYNYDGTTTGNKIAKSLAAKTDWTSSSVIGSVGNTDYPAKRNQTGFTALPGGYRSRSGTFYSIHDRGLWWSQLITSNWYRSIDYNLREVTRLSDLPEDSGLSVRCVRD
jgi:uncharacterized protein (TIGR02145 family)